MTESIVFLIMMGMCILGMLGAFYLGTGKYQDRMFDSHKSYDVTEGQMDIPEEPTEEDYQESLKSWKMHGETEAESNTG